MSSTVDNSAKKGHILLLSTMVVTLVVPLALIILSYMDIISGTAQYIAAAGVIASSIYIIGGGLLMAFQDKKDGETLSDG
ncbi:MAG: hypothetical protein DSZ20_04055 [Candidatus Thioglobus sp.]|nr:MAG: hypothetical protein DSZ15_00180 [Candidatus Thioglobus sp.]RUM80909.1 MAG: hypothetical protein DSZ14_01340 [Candidatus Thioglobus sp.]RUM81494.1 MAG: hypothetical protein DSZ16_04325 [Candidatus Thioglobus sp.]RUM82763.1 MAG: hypothetical protein DSZ17_03645 [Candidatus Thioglobus sp.]RUM86082.1 MAG: hypothetical protein DSZ20_04055 [Candidatus Thioglobus sp.]